MPLFFVLVLIFPSVATVRAEESLSLSSLIAKAKTEKLYEDRKWLKLLHYSPGLGGDRSVVDDPRFFLSPDGKRNPEAELIATIKALFDRSHRGDEHALCRFPARARWLIERLDIKKEDLPEVKCRELDRFLEAVKPEKAYLVFASSFMGSPASMFGHTFLIISPEGTDSKLLSYAANYAADATDRNGLLYAFKGVFGFYKGYFTVLPYYDKIRQYSNIEHRDLWEYPLNLTPEEVRFMVLHLWELKGIYSYYYFFDENCSYHLLFLIDAVRSERSLTDRLAFWVIPVDTIRWAMDRGLISSPVFRPSKVTKIRAYAGQIERDLIEIAKAIAYGKKPPEAILQTDYSTEQKAWAYEVASELIEVEYIKKTITQEEYQRRLLSVLKARTPLGVVEPVKISVPERPEHGHGSGRLSMVYGQRGKEDFIEVSLRPAYHDLMDPDEGYLEGSEIVFGEVSLRHSTDTGTTHLQDLKVISIQSFPVRDIFFKPMSWSVSGGYTKVETPEGYRGSLVLETGGGYTWALTDRGRVFIMGQASGLYSSAFRRDYSIGVGFRTGFFLQPLRAVKLGVQLRAMDYELGDRNKRYNGEVALNLRVHRNLSLRLTYQREKTFGRYVTELRSALNVYF